MKESTGAIQGGQEDDQGPEQERIHDQRNKVKGPIEGKQDIIKNDFHGKCRLPFSGYLGYKGLCRSGQEVNRLIRKDERRTSNVEVP